MGIYFYTLYIIISTLCLLMGGVFLFVYVPDNKHLRNYRISLKIFAADYILLGVLDLLVVFWLKDPSIQPFSFIGTLISTLQSFLFTFALINLLNPQFVTLRKLLLNALPLVLFTLIYMAFVSIFGNIEINSLLEIREGIMHPTMFVRVSFSAFYAVQMSYYTYLIILNTRKFRSEIENYFSDTHRLNLKVFQSMAGSAILIGILAFFTQIIPHQTFQYTVLVAIVIFYLLCSLLFINYNKVFVIIEPVIVPVSETGFEGLLEQPNTNWRKWRNRIIEEKLYLKEQITLEEIAQTLQISRTTLSNLINAKEKQNFYGWINSLRIEHAKTIIAENPDYTVAQIARLTGFTETSNFSRTFKKVTGNTPSGWRSENL
jgi:AraC-like DNA-binding protein